MMFGHFNRLTARHGKLIFAIIAVVIGISFIGFFDPSLMNAFKGKKNPKAVIVTVFGTSITNDDAQQRASYSLLNGALTYGPFALNNQYFLQMAQQGATNELIMLAAAKEVGIEVSDVEVIDFIKASNQMQTDGAFDKVKYDAFVKNTVSRMRLNTKDVEEAVRQTLTLQRLNEYIAGNVIVTDGEVKEHFNNLYTKISAKVARFDSKDYKNDVKASPNDLKAYYDKNKDSYMSKEQYKIVVAKFNTVAFVEEAKKAIDDAALKADYEANKAQYKKDDKEQPFEAVKATILAKLAKEKAQALAFARANEFANTAYDGIKDLESHDEKEKVFNAEYAAFSKGAMGECVECDWFEQGATTISKVFPG